MFGLTKETILKNLMVDYQTLSESQFKNKFTKILSNLRTDKKLKEFFKFYTSVDELMFDDVSIAREYITEGIEHLKSINIDSWLNKYKNIKQVDYLPEHIECLDKLIFEKNLDVVDKLKYKARLLEYLTKQNISETSVNDNLTLVEERINSLNEHQKEVIDLFFENDGSKISEYYNNLINECFDKFNKLCKNENDISVIRNLNEATLKLHNLSKEEPNIENIEKLLHLKEIN